MTSRESINRHLSSPQRSPRQRRDNRRNRPPLFETKVNSGLCNRNGSRQQESRPGNILPSMQSREPPLDSPMGLSARMGSRSGQDHTMDETHNGEDHMEPARKVKKIYTWICGYCGNEFETEYYSQRYCNPTHKQYAYNERKRRRLDSD